MFLMYFDVLISFVVFTIPGFMRRRKILQVKVNIVVSSDNITCPIVLALGNILNIENNSGSLSS